MVGPQGETTYNLHNGSWEGGKGSHTRGKDKKSYDAYADGWDAIFGKKKVEKKDETTEETTTSKDEVPPSSI
jgi:hypothetical protein